jgi:predicted nucleotidyltransferase
MLDKNQARELALKYTDIVRQTYHPSQVILFGSYIDGSPHEHSDIDVAIVFNDYEGDWHEAWTEMFQLRESLSFDIEPHMMDETSDHSGFLEYIRKTGEIIYEQ